MCLCYLRSDAMQDASATFSGFAAACAAAGDECALTATAGSTPAAIIEWTQKLLDAAFDFYVAHPSDSILSSSFIRSKSTIINLIISGLTLNIRLHL
jgi:hypothetical protein